MDVVIDDIVIDDRLTNPPAEITADGNFDITVYLNGSVIGRGANRNSGERFQGLSVSTIMLSALRSMVRAMTSIVS